MLYAKKEVDNFYTIATAEELQDEFAQCLYADIYEDFNEWLYDDTFALPLPKGWRDSEALFYLCVGDFAIDSEHDLIVTIEWLKDTFKNGIDGFFDAWEETRNIFDSDFESFLCECKKCGFVHPIVLGDAV